MAQRYFGFLNLTRQYLKSLGQQAIALPDYGVRLLWDNWFRALNPRGNIAATLPPRNLAAYYDLSNSSSYITATGVKLLGDLSGNSNTNVLALNGVAGNYASTPDSAAVSVTGDIDVRCYLEMDAWSVASDKYFVGHATSISRAFLFGTNAGKLILYVSTDGTTWASGASYQATATHGIADFADSWVRVTRASATGAINFYKSSDGVTWTQIGTQVAGASGAFFDSTAALEIGTWTGNNFVLSGKIYRAQIYNGIAGTLVFDADFTAQSKLAATFTESSSNAATVTINTSGDLGARICGARDLVQMTGTKQPVLTAGGSPYITFDGTDDHMRAAAWAMAQPVTVYFVGSQVTWTSTDCIYDGASANVVMALEQRNSTPNVRARGTAAALGDITTWALNTPAIFTAVFNGASSAERLNRTTATTGSVTVIDPNGFALGSAANGGIGWSNITVSEVLIYNEAHTTAQQNQILQYLAVKWKIALT